MKRKVHCPPRLIRWTGLAVLLIFSLLCSFTETTLSGNDASRFAVVQAVGEQHVFHIENTCFRTVDAVRRNGHVYSDKPLPTAWIFGMFHRGLHHWTGWSFPTRYSLLVWLINFLQGFLWNALLFLWLYNMFRRLKVRAPILKGVLALCGVCSTWILSYSVLLNNHVPAAVAVLAVYIMLDKFRRAPSSGLAAGIGTAAGLVFAADIPMGGLCCAAAALAVWKMTELKNGIAACLGSIWVIAGCILLNFYAYGTWLPLYLAGGTGTFHIAIAVNPGYIFEALLGYRGFFLYQPFLLLGLWYGRQESVPDRAMYVFALAGITFYVLFTNEFGGPAYGFRYLIPLIPILYYRAGKRLLNCPKWRPAAGILILWGIVTALIGACNPFCVAYEGYRSPEGHFTRTVRSSFGGNLLCAGFEYAPDSALTQALIRHYGPEISRRFLYESYFNLKRPDLIRKVLQFKSERANFKAVGRTFETGSKKEAAPHETK